MAGASYTRVLVHLRKTSCGEPYRVAKFSECVLDNLGLGGDGFVECKLEANKLLLQRPARLEHDKAAPGTVSHIKIPTYRLMHPPFCPVQHMDDNDIAALEPEFYNRGVDVGVAILLESCDKRLLLTRRAPHMRTFPGTWVPPGGHVEDGETLEDAALRELEEETGLVVTPAERETSSILGLWESVFPPLLAMGSPKRHHIVVYMNITLKKTSFELQNNFKLCPEEVDAAVWLSEELVRAAVWKDSGDEGDIAGSPKEDEKIPLTLVNRMGDHAPGYFNATLLREKTSSEDLNKERISTGSRYALALWLENNLPVGSSQKDLYKGFLEKYVRPKTEAENKSSNL